MGRTLYATDDQTRFFLVPDDATLPAGDLVVRSLTGRKRSVDPTVLDVYEVPEEEAKRLVAEQVREMGAKVRGVLGAVGKALMEAPRLDPADVAAREQRVADNLKLGRDELSDPDKLAGAVSALVKGVLSTAAAAVNDPAVAEARMKDVVEALRKEGAGEDAAASVEALPQRLRELLASEETLKALDEATEKLKAAAAELDAEMERDRMLRAAGRQTPGEA